MYGIFTWKPSQENEDPATCPEQEAFIAFRLKKKICEEWVGLGWWRINKEDKGEFNKVFLSVFSAPHSSSLLMRNLSSQHRECTFHMGAFWCDSGTRVWEEGQGDLPAFLKLLQLKLYNVPRCNVSWTLSQTNDVPRLCLKDFSPSQKPTHLKGWTVLSSLVCFRR